MHLGTRLGPRGMQNGAMAHGKGLDVTRLYFQAVNSCTSAGSIVNNLHFKRNSTLHLEPNESSEMRIVESSLLG